MLTRRMLFAAGMSVVSARAARAHMYPMVAANGLPSDMNHELDSNIQSWFDNAKNSDNEGCCGVADGFRRSVIYRVPTWAEGKYRPLNQVIFKDFERRPDAYWVEVFNMQTLQYETLPVPTWAMVHKANPTGDEIVWLWSPAQKLEVRCFALVTEG